MDVDGRVDLRQKFLKFPLRILHVFGLWRKNRNIYLYTLYSLLVLLSTQYCYALFQIIYMVIAWGDIEKIAEASFLLLTQATLCLKIIFYSRKRDKVVQLTKAMDCNTFAPSKANHITILEEHSRVQLIEYWIFQFMSTSTIALWAIFPLIDAEPGEKVLPFKAWYPLSQNKTPHYEILYFYQIVGIWFSSLINVSIDRISTSMTGFGCAQLLIIHDNLVNVEEYAVEEMGFNSKMLHDRASPNEILEKVIETDGTLGVNYQNDLEKLIEKKLVDCILHHQEVVRFMADVEECFHMGIFAQFIASVLIICITGLQLTLVDPKSFKFITKISYLLAMLAQIFFICRIGDKLSVISTGLINAAYHSPWMNRSKKFKRLLIVFMERLKRPVITRAGYFFPLSLQTFMSILRSSYSYFAVLQQMNSKK